MSSEPPSSSSAEKFAETESCATLLPRTTRAATDEATGRARRAVVPLWTCARRPSSLAFALAADALAALLPGTRIESGAGDVGATTAAVAAAVVCCAATGI